MAKILGTTFGVPEADESTLYLVHYVGGQMISPDEEDETIVRIMKREQFEDEAKWVDAVDYFLLQDDADVIWWVPMAAVVKELSRSL